MRKSFISAPALSLALTASAFAADLPSYKAPLIAPPPAFSWTGLYGGVNIGYGFGSGGRDTGVLAYYAIGNAIALPTGTAWYISNDLNGVLGGGQVGYNFQFNPWLVVGLEADIQATDIHSQGNGVGAGSYALGVHTAYATQNKSVDWFGTVRGRVGVTFPSMPNLMIYGTGGLAYGGVVSSFNISDYYPTIAAGGSGVVVGAGTNYDQTKVGWTAGGGVEWFPLISSPLFKAFSVKLEYLYTDLGPTTLYGSSLGSIPTGGPAFAYKQTSNTRWNTVRVGVNWHFDPFAPAAVLAKY